MYLRHSYKPNMGISLSWLRLSPVRKHLYTASLAIAVLCQLPYASASELTGRVVGVADGDTITVLDQENSTYKVRLAGIDAPEKRQAFGQRSKQALSDAVFGRTVTVDWSKHDRYGRLVGKVLLPGGGDANRRQVELGYAWHYKAYEREQSPEDRRSYAIAERDARKARVGLWADPQPTPPWDFRRVR